MALWEKGKSANPGGRPKGLIGIAKMIREQTNDGADLVNFFIDTYLHAGRHSERIKAAEWLMDRGFGKAMQPTELSGGLTISVAPAIDLSRLTTDELAQLEALVRRSQSVDLPAQNGGFGDAIVAVQPRQLGNGAQTPESQ